jgi:hypothetical protein
MARQNGDPMKDLFGGVIHSSGKGFYVGAELFAILSGRLRMEQTDVLEKDSDKLEYVRQSSWIAQILATSTTHSIMEQSEGADNTEHVGTSRVLAKSYRGLIDVLPEIFDGSDEQRLMMSDQVGDLLRSLLVPRPFETDRRSSGALKWQTYLFSPVVPELISDETIVKKDGLELSRNQYRGAGALAYQMLCRSKDENEDFRFQSTNEGLKKLVSPREDGLFQLFSKMRELSLTKFSDTEVHDYAPKEVLTLNSFATTIDTNAARDFRSATLAILSLPDSVTNFRKTKYLLYLSGFFTARHVLECSQKKVEEQDASRVSVLSFSRNPQIETLSRETRSRHSRVVDNAVKMLHDGIPNREPSSFYNKTSQNLGFIDLRGRFMNYTLKLPLLEALIFAACSREELDNGISLDEFDVVLWKKYQFLVGPTSAKLAEAETGFETFIPPSVFQENLQSLSKNLEQLGFLNSYSDATQILRGGLQ